MMRISTTARAMMRSRWMNPPIVVAVIIPSAQRSRRTTKIVISMGVSSSGFQALDAASTPPGPARRPKGPALSRLRRGGGGDRRQEGGEVLGMLLLAREDVLEHPPGGRIVVADEADRLAVAVDGDALG